MVVKSLHRHECQDLSLDRDDPEEQPPTDNKEPELCRGTRIRANCEYATASVCVFYLCFR